MYCLREIERRDIPEINKWRNNPGLVANLGAPFRYIGSEVDNAWFDSYLKNRVNTVRCAVVDENDVLIGVVYLTGIDYLHRSAELSVMIGNPEHRGKGAGSFAVNEMLKHAFFNLNLNRVELGVLSSNKTAVGFYEKNGFIREGVKREARYKNGEYVDLLMYAVLREEYTANGN